MHTPEYILYSAITKYRNNTVYGPELHSHRGSRGHVSVYSEASFAWCKVSGETLSKTKTCKTKELRWNALFSRSSGFYIKLTTNYKTEFFQLKRPFIFCLLFLFTLIGKHLVRRSDKGKIKSIYCAVFILGTKITISKE